jgi:hypothetical protein
MRRAAWSPTFRCRSERECGDRSRVRGFAHVEESNRLVLQGWPIQIDGRRLKNDLVPILARLSEAPLSRATINTLTLLPAAGYGFYPGAGLVADSWFDVTRDGTLKFSVLYAGFCKAGIRKP